MNSGILIDITLRATAANLVWKGRVALSSTRSPLATRPYNQLEKQGLIALYGEMAENAIL